MKLYSVRNWVTFYYVDEILPGENTEIGVKKVRINSVEPKNMIRTTWCQPEKDDIHRYSFEDTIRKSYMFS